MITPGQTPHSPRPWKVEWGALVTAADGRIVFDMCGIDFHCNEANADLIVEAVNTYAELQAEVERLKVVASEAQLEVIFFRDLSIARAQQVESAEAQIRDYPAVMGSLRALKDDYLRKCDAALMRATAAEAQLTEAQALLKLPRRRVEKHGTLNEYHNHKCRCAECRAANAQYTAAYRKARKHQQEKVNDTRKDDTSGD